jgi:ZIP Zinc transporter.
MLVIEQLVSPHSHSHSPALPLRSVKDEEPRGNSELELFDAELGPLDREHDAGHSGFVQVDIPDPLELEETRGGKELAFPLTFGLVIHGLADGLALGVSALQSSESGVLSNLSLIVFLALIIHKGNNECSLML